MRRRRRELLDALFEIAVVIPGEGAPYWYLDGPADEIPDLNDPAKIRAEANDLIERMRERARDALPADYKRRLPR